MSKLKDKILAGVFVGFIFVSAILFVLLPKNEFSVNEKRNLEKLPDVKNILNGKFESGMENYLTDHFPFRDKWVAVNSYFSLYTGRNGTNGVYKCKNGYIINDALTDDDGKFNENIKAINNFAAKTDIPITVMIVPATGSIMTEYLPLNHIPYNDDEYIDRARDELNNVCFLDIRDKFREEVSGGEQLYYKTDHHWTSKGAYIAYSLIEPDAKDENEFRIERYDGFFGTTYSKSALWNEDGESIELWTYPINAAVKISDGIREKTAEDMFFREHLDEADKYPVFLDGNHSFVRIENEDIPEGKTLLIKDSYAHCLAPFLALHTGIIDMVDLRYYFEPVSELVKKENYDNIIIVYGIENLVEFSDISILE